MFYKKQKSQLQLLTEESAGIMSVFTETVTQLKDVNERIDTHNNEKEEEIKLHEEEIRKHRQDQSILAKQKETNAKTIDKINSFLND